MALFLFTRAMLAGEPIKVFNHGRHMRDFTYIDDIVEGVVRITRAIPQADPQWDAHHPDPSRSAAPYRVYNIGNSKPVQLEDFIAALEHKLGRKALRENLPLQTGDVPDTWADCSDLVRDFDYQPATPVEEGISRFVDWYLEWQQGAA
jgi:UDP-glucuronate 4-epimerase